MLVQVAQREVCEVSILRDFQRLSGHGPGELSVPASASGRSRWHPEVPHNLSHSVALCTMPSCPTKARAEGRGMCAIQDVSDFSCSGSSSRSWAEARQPREGVLLQQS